MKIATRLARRLAFFRRILKIAVAANRPTTKKHELVNISNHIIFQEAGALVSDYRHAADQQRGLAIANARQF
jgi:hypothetical protein